MLKRKLDRPRRWLSERLAAPQAIGARSRSTDLPGAPKVTSSRARRTLALSCAIIFLIALAVRLLYWQDASAEIARGDSTIQALAVPYRDEARRMLDTGRVLFPPGPADQGDGRVIVHPPGYAILMAIFTLLFGSPDSPLRLTQIIFAAAQAVIVVLIAKELLPAPLAIIAGALAALSPHLAYYSIFLSPDSLAVFPILMAVYLLIRGGRRPRLTVIIVAGIFAGLSCWLRSNALLLSFFLALVVLFCFERGKRLRYSLALLAASLLVIAPITLRNWIVYDRFIPISIGSGLNLIEGIAEYDKQGRFGLPILDPDVLKGEQERYGRPDYGQSLYFPDGVERDQARFARGLSVIRSNPGWFTRVVLRRMVFMLRYNDFRLENPSFNTPIAPAVSAHPNFGHKPAVPDNMPPARALSMSEALADATFAAPEAGVSVDEQDGSLQIVGDSSEFADQFISGPIAVQPGTDYILALEIKQARGALSVKVRTADPRIILASSRIRGRKLKRKAVDLENDQSNSADRVYLDFATGDVSEVRIAIANHKVTASDRKEPDRPVVKLGRADLFQLGATPYQWTHYPRSLIRGIQKNLYKTEWMWLLISIGAALLVLARRGRALLILSAVPAYYLIVHSALHTEYRYILAIHYFLFVIAAATLYIASKIVQRGATSGAQQAIR